MNLQETIRRILREETKLSDYIRRRVTANDLERLVRDVKISISGGKDKSDALYDAIQNFISSNRKQFKDYIWLRSNHLESLIKYINSKLDEEPLNESILMKETSDQESVKDLVSEMGIYQTSKMFGGIKGLYSELGFTGTQEEMIFIVDTIMRHEVPVVDNICDFKIEPTLHSLKLYVEIPKYYPNLDDDNWGNKQMILKVTDRIQTFIHRLGNGLVRGCYVKVSLGKCQDEEEI